MDQDIVLVTGGASGIGRLMALGFAQRAKAVVLWDVDEKGLENGMRCDDDDDDDDDENEM
jgi:NAD(P)-dependent dehydrogenase (short-subunit alcohol dehydrogenase family)